MRFCHQTVKLGTSISWGVNGKSCNALDPGTEPWHSSTAGSRAAEQETSISLMFHLRVNGSSIKDVCKKGGEGHPNADKGRGYVHSRCAHLNLVHAMALVQLVA